MTGQLRQAVIIVSAMCVTLCYAARSHPQVVERRDPLVELITGMLSGVITAFLFFPLECVEARIQISSKRDQTLIQRMKNIITKEGFSGLYVGLLPTLLGGMINWGLYFFIYNGANGWWYSAYGISGSVWTQLASGIIAGAVCACVVNPFWVLKIHVINSKNNISMLEALQQILIQDGVAGLYKGLGPSLLGTTEGATQFATYEQLKIFLSGPTGLSTVNQLLAGGISRAIATLVTYPYVLLRSVLQVQNSQYTSLADACTKIYRKDGISGLYRGMYTNLIRNVPPAAFMFLLVEKIRVALMIYLRT